MKFLNYFYNLFTEARRNLFPKKSVVEVLEKYKDREDVFVSFRDKITWISQIDGSYSKELDVGIGLNTRNLYNTPTGIYGYVLKPLWDRFKINDLPFGNHRPNIVVFKPNYKAFGDDEKILRSSNFTETDLREGEERIKKVLNYTDQDITTLYNSINSMYKNTPFRTFWSLLREISIVKTSNNQRLSGAKHVNYWTLLLIKLGYPIMVDDAGTGTIHSNEPVQCFITAKRYAEVLETIENKNWKSVGESSRSIITEKIFNDIIDGKPLHKWLKTIEKFPENIKRNLISKIVNNIQCTKHLTYKDFSVLEFAKYIPQTNYYLNQYVNVTINRDLVKYLYENINKSNCLNFLLCYFFCLSPFGEDKDLFKLIYRVIFSNLTTTSKDNEFMNLQIINDIIAKHFKKHPKAMELILKLVIKYTSFKEKNTLSELSLLLLTVKPDKDNHVWKMIRKKINYGDEIQELCRYLMIRIKFSTNIKTFMPDWLQAYIPYFFKENKSTVYDYIFLLDHNTFLIDKLDVENVCNLIFHSSVVNFDEKVLNACLAAVQKFNKAEVKSEFNKAIKNSSYVVSDTIIASNFEGLPDYLKEYLLRNHEEFVDLLIRSYLKTVDVSIQQIYDNVGYDNTRIWLKTNASQVINTIFDANFLNSLSDQHIFSNSDAANEFLTGVYTKVVGLGGIYKFIEYFHSLNKDNRQDLVDNGSFEKLSYINDFVEDFNFNELMKYCNDVINHNDQDIPIAFLMQKIKEYILSDKAFVKTILKNAKRFSTTPEFTIAYLENYIPMFSCSEKNNKTLAYIFSDIKTYSKSGTIISISYIKNGEVFCIKKDSFVNILNQSDTELPENYLTDTIFNKSNTQHNVDVLQAFINKYENLIPVAFDRDNLMSIIQEPYYNPDKFYFINNENKIQQYKKEDLDSTNIAFPFFISEDYYSHIFGQLPENYNALKAGTIPLISQEDKESLLEFIKSTSRIKRVRTVKERTYIIFPEDKRYMYGITLNDLYYYNNSVTAPRMNRLVESELLYSSHEEVYILLERLREIVHVPEELIDVSVKKEIIELMLTNMNEIPEKILNNRPVDTMLSYERKLVFLGKGLDSTSWQEELNLPNASKIYYFSYDIWYNNLSGKSPDNYFALLKDEWQKITNITVPDSYYIMPVSEETKQMMLDNYNDQEILNIIKKNNPLRYMNVGNKQLVLLGKGLLENPWYLRLRLGVQDVYYITKDGDLWDNYDGGGNPCLFYAIERTLWEHKTGVRVSDDYFKTDNDAFSDKNKSIELLKERMYSVPESMMQQLPDIKSSNLLYDENAAPLVFLGAGIQMSNGDGWKQILNSENISIWFPGTLRWSYPQKDGNLEDHFYAVAKQDWEAYTGITVGEDYYAKYVKPEKVDDAKEPKEDQGLI